MKDVVVSVIALYTVDVNVYIAMYLTNTFNDD